MLTPPPARYKRVQCGAEATLNRFTTPIFAYISLRLAPSGAIMPDTF